jgi:hypothetical protein
MQANLPLIQYCQVYWEGFDARRKRKANDKTSTPAAQDFDMASLIFTDGHRWRESKDAD